MVREKKKLFGVYLEEKKIWRLNFILQKEGLVIIPNKNSLYPKIISSYRKI